ncbi:MAG TPA: glycosyltransferase [Thermoleophilaceae bacterium]|nr:glycosyltransferase [Thermoleophilaceae bacterium]
MASLMGGGAERQMGLLLNRLDRAHFDPALSLFEKRGEFLSRLADDVPVSGLGKRSARDAPLMVTRLAKQMREVQPDVVFSKVDYTNVVVALAAWLARSDAALVLGEVSLQSGALQNMSYPALRRALLRWSYPRAASVVVSTPGVARDLEELGVSARFDVVPNMLALAEAQDSAAEQQPHPFDGGGAAVVSAVGRLAAGKGHADLLRAFELLRRRRPCKLLLIGDGPERQSLEALAAQLELGGDVAFMGFVENPHAVVAETDVFVSPSHFESFGNAIVEAMALGVPVVSTRVPAGPEWLIEDRRSGVFANAHDPEDLAQKTELVLDDAQLRAEIAAGGRKAARRFDIPTVVAAYEAVFERVAADRVAGRLAGDRDLA